MKIRPNARWADERQGLSGELAVGLGAAAVFICLALWVMSGGAGVFDTAVRTHIHTAYVPGLTYLMVRITAVGEAWFLALLGALVCWRLAAAGRLREMAWFAAAALGSEGLDQVLKHWFRRTRPLAFFGVSPANYSFPSGHAFVSLCTYVVLAEIIINPAWPRGRKSAVRAGAVLLAALIGLSRVYLGVHFPTDVLAGFAGAIVWLAVLRSVYKLRLSSGKPVDQHASPRRGLPRASDGRA